MHLKVCSRIHTNAVDIELDFGAQKLVPLVNGVNQVAAALERASATEGMRKRGIRRKVGFDGFGLLRRRSFTKLMDNTSDLFRRIVHGWVDEWICTVRCKDTDRSYKDKGGCMEDGEEAEEEEEAVNGSDM
jgi:hypothetical protein